MPPLLFLRAAMPPAPSRGMAARSQSGGMAAALRLDVSEHEA